MNFPKPLWEVLFLLCLHQCLLPCAAARPLDDWAGSVKKASSHKHWEHIVKRSAFYSRFTSDDGQDETSHIVNVQDYYKTVFDEGWDTYRSNDRELFALLNKLEKVVEQGHKRPNAGRVSSQGTADTMEFGLHSKPIRGRYIVMFQSSAGDYTLDRTMAVLQNANAASSMRIRATDMSPLRYVGKGFTATLNGRAVELMEKHPALAYIEEDVALRRSGIITHAESEVIASDAVPWNLDRLDQHSNHLDHTYSPYGDGRDVDIYIIDTGVRATHQELAGRVHYAGFDMVDELTGSTNRGEDCNGHGTHCAGTAAGKTFGVAKKANIYNLRALNCEGTGAVSGIVTGIDRIIKQKLEGGTGRPIVISQSLGVKKSESLNRAINEASKAGITCVGAAGNQGSYSCDYSPASAASGIAVGATDENDDVTMFSNTGECTTIMAPGMHITSSTNSCDTCTKTLSGTSMAGPHAAGVAAIMLSKSPELSADQVKEKMIAQSTKGHVVMSSIASTRRHVTPNRLLYVQSSTVAIKDDDVASIQFFHSRP